MTNLIDRAWGALHCIVPAGFGKKAAMPASLRPASLWSVSLWPDSFLRGGAALALTAGLAGCTGGPLTGTANVYGAQAVSEVPATRAFVMPAPGGPRIIGVIERRHANAIEQEIALATEASTPGQNQYKVQVFGIGSAARESRLTSPLPEASQIRAELAAAFPGVRMSISPLFAQNDYGPFGYATGRGAGSDLCFYAWQRLGGTEAAANGSIQLRLRFCQAGASEQSLLAEMYGFALAVESSAPDWNPYGKPAPLSPVIGAAMAPVVPTGFGAPSVTASGAAPVAAGRRSVAPRRAPAAVLPERDVADAAPVAPYDLRREAAYAAQINARRDGVVSTLSAPNVPPPPSAIPIWQDRHAEGVAAGTRPSGVSVPEVPLPSASTGTGSGTGTGVAPSVPLPSSTGSY